MTPSHARARPTLSRRMCLPLLACGLLTGAAALAQPAGWPARPITLVVTYPPGGGADIMARLIAPRLGEALGQNVVIDNRPGAGGQIGAAYVAKARPDGHTLMFDASSFAVNPALYPRLPYDSARAFQPIGVTALFPNVVLVNAGFGANDLPGLIQRARAGKDAVSYASSGNGSAQHLAGALFESAAGVSMVHVPYRGGGPALNDVIGGQVPLFFGNLAPTLAHIQSGKLRPLAVTSAKRSALLPDVPTLAEAGMKDAEVYEWNALFAPAGTPEAVVQRLADALQKALAAPEVQKRIAQLGGEVQQTSPEQARAFIQQQTARWADVIKARSISAD
ncbi:MAG: tripartite tricarboxylate transporter substrate binding protein [Pseudomonadota bacterium]|nr:tripartite tricarboxylate transporter substrate binding protein [Pseudomonadota bacterium]